MAPMTPNELEKMRRDDHDKLIKLEGCFARLQERVDNHFKALKEDHAEVRGDLRSLHLEIKPLVAFFGGASIGFKMFRYLVAAAASVALIWNVIEVVVGLAAGVAPTNGG